MIFLTAVVSDEFAINGSNIHELRRLILASTLYNKQELSGMGVALTLRNEYFLCT